MTDHTTGEYEELLRETERLRLENKKVNRQLTALRDLIERAKTAANGRAAFGSVISTERAHQEIFLSLLLKNSPDIIIIMNNERRFLYCTEAFLEKAHVGNFGLISGKPFSWVFRSFMEASEINRMMYIFERAMSEKKNISLERTIDFGKEGYPRTYSIHFTPMAEARGNVIGAMALFHDMTDFLQAQESLAASKAKSEFLATMSHEIRTPLNAIIGLSEVELQETLPDRTRDNLEKIYASGSGLLNIVNDILDISKIESGNLELIPVEYDIANLINDTVQINIVRIGSKKITFDLDVDDTIPAGLVGDELRIRQILSNLLSNAFKYTERGKVVLRATWKKHEEDAEIVFVVSDTGRGIRKDDVERLFVEYRQMDTRANRHIEGTGLGLSITKNLLDLMKGSVHVESEYGRGSVFTVKIRQRIHNGVPIGRETVSNLKEFRFVGNGRTRSKNFIRNPMPYGKVLVVDDVPTNLDVARGLLLPYGLSIDTALSAREAIDKIRSENPRYDLIFMDHMMPEMDGLEAAHVIREEIGTEYARKVPIVALTANALSGNREMFLSHGFDAFISKPIDIQQMDRTLNKWIKDKQTPETLKWAESQANPKTESDEMKLEGFDVDGLDIAFGVQRYGGGGAYLKILDSYLTHTPLLLSKMKDPTKADLSEYTINVHGLKGSSNGIGATLVAKRAEALELAAKAGDFEAVISENDAFISLTEALLAGINAMLRKAEGLIGKREQRPEPDRALLFRLMEAAKHFKTAAMDDIIIELRSYDYEADGELVTWLKEQLDNLEYSAICDRLESVLSTSQCP
ncbi:hybrid sensor histidine kinase/response regulator [Synergistales bacterium]|nr:hybrid sensor histidine kinase/response regulator [Synergistales bacterium]